jgi:hypothetical protein
LVPRDEFGDIERLGALEPDVFGGVAGRPELPDDLADLQFGERISEMLRERRPVSV